MSFMLTRRVAAAATALAAVAAVAVPGVAHSTQASHGSEPVETRSAVSHVVVIVQENHSFDQYFGAYCRASGTCNLGGEANPYAPLTPVTTTDATTMAYDPNHDRACELDEMDGGKMDAYVAPDPAASFATGYPCGNPANFAEATADASSPVHTYQDWAAHTGALADNYFQPVAGASSSNDMYFWTTHFVFPDNSVEPDAMGKQCSTNSTVARYDDASNPNLGHLLDGAGVGWAWYAEGYNDMKTASATPPGCPVPPVDCGAHVPSYPCVFDPSDIPSEYYASSVDNPAHMKDYTQLQQDITSGSLPPVTFVKAIGYRSEHPGYGSKLSDGVAFVQRTVDAIENSPSLAGNTLVLLSWDESGGYWDHAAPPPSIETYSAAQGGGPVPYGPRVPFLALGSFARAGVVSHALLEHSSVTKFIEWNWLRGQTGQLGGRDASPAVHNLGSLLDPSLEVPN